MADSITMNLGFGAPESSLYGRFAEIFKAKVADHSNGEIQVKLRCCNQIASEDEAFKAMQLGIVDGYVITANNVAPHWSLIDVTVLPYVFQDAAHMDRVLGGEIGQMMKTQLQADTSVHLLAFGPALYRDFYNSVRPVNTIEDMDGLTVRVPKNEVMIATFKAFGANPVPLAWSETPTALQTGTVNGGDNGTAFIRDMKFYEHQTHLSVLEHFASFAPLLASDSFMRRLTDEQRAQIKAAAKEAESEFTALYASKTEDIRRWLVEEGGMIRTDPDCAAFIAAAQGVQQALVNQRGEEFGALVNAIQAAAE